MPVWAAVLAQAGMAAAAVAQPIAPPIGRPIRHLIEQRRDDGRATRTFRQRREVTFAAEPGGFRATVVLKAVEAAAPPAERARFRAANAPLLGRPIVVRLDAAGRVREVADLPAVWSAWRAGLAAAAGTGDAARALARRLDALPPAARDAVVGSAAAALFAADEERAAAPPRPVALASGPPFAGAALRGTTVVAAGAGGLSVRTRAAGTAGDRPGAPAITLAIDRSVDAATGLIRHAERRERVVAGGTALTLTTLERIAW